MPHVPGLRSPYVMVGRLVYFGRMLDKIRLHARGLLPGDYHEFLGKGFDGRTCQFLGIDYAALRPIALNQANDPEVLAWCEKNGTPRADADCQAWNNFVLKRGWRDDGSMILRQRVNDQGLAGQGIETFFDLIEFDEGRPVEGRHAWDLLPARAAIVMGVAGSGKSTVGAALADALGWRFVDADTFHPPANVAKMSAGLPLDDADREPWLIALRDYLAASLHEGVSVVLACSALKARYRATLAKDRRDVQIVYLHAPTDVLASRLENRPGHFMKTSMLASQLATLETPSPEESIHADVSHPLDKVVAQLAATLRAIH